MKMMRKKRTLSILLIACFMLGSILPAPFAVEAADGGNKKDALLLCGIMDGFDRSMLGSSKAVTRARFARMLTNASGLSVSSGNALKTSLFKDVSYKNEYAPYIRIAVEKGWMSASVSGNFSPNSKITMKDAAKGVLALLGYTGENFSGNLINAQMNKLNELGLNKKINKTKNQILSFANCTNLFYNLLTAKTLQNTYFGAGLQVPVSDDGAVDYLSLLKANLTGPALLTGSLSSLLPFGASGAIIYRNEKKSSASAIQIFDVIYYSEALKTVWAYNEKVSGILESVSPNRSAPESVVIGGQSYILGTKKLAYAFSGLGNFTVNDSLTLFLGMNGEAAAALDSRQYAADTGGVVLSVAPYVGSSSDSDANDKSLTLAAANGRKSTFYYSSKSLTASVGDFIHVTNNGGKQKIVKSASSNEKLEGAVVKADSGKIGAYDAAPDIRIAEVYKEQIKTLSLGRLNDVTLSGLNLIWYELNGKGEVASLIVTGVTFGGFDYGIVTETLSQMDSIAYKYLTNGAEKTADAGLSDGMITPDSGLKISYYYDAYDTLISIKFQELASIQAVKINGSFVSFASGKKTVSPDAAVYYKDSDRNYHAASLSKITNLNKYAVTAYYDESTGSARDIVLLIAVDK